MRPTITEQSFYRYLKCPSWIAHEAKNAGAEDVLRDLLQQDGLLPDKERELIGTYRHDIVEVESLDPEDAARQTLALMQKGTLTVYNGALVFGHCVARPDMLERVEGRSTFGDFYYIACDVKRSRHMKDEYRMQGVFYAELLKQVQGVRPTQGYVMHLDGTVESYRIDEFATEYRLTFDAILRIMDGDEEPHFLTSDCKQSPWFAACREQADVCDDLSRLNRLWRSEALILRKEGVDTVSAFAEEHIDMLTARIHGIAPERLRYLHLEAIALKTGKTQMLNRIDVPRTKPILVVDVESDPLRDLHYLFGVLVVDDSGETYHAFLAKKPEDEANAWREFTDFMAGYPGVPLVHYGWYEQDVFRVMKERYGAPSGIFAGLGEESIDLLTRLRESVIFPLSFYSLKDIAKFLGFRWRHDDASGLNSVLWFEEWLKTGDESVLTDIVHYNEDDVRATWHVYAWALKNVL